MAQAQKLTSITLLVEDAERRNNITSETNIHDVESVTEAQDAPADSNAPDGENTTKVKDAPAMADTPDNKSITEIPVASENEPKEKKPRGKKGETKKETKNVSRGITSKSPIVRLLDDEKSFIKRLEAHILLETGEIVTDHQLIMDAVREYTKKHHPDFQ